MIPQEITRDHVLMAIKELDEKGYPPEYDPTGYLLEYNGKLYPPKYAISTAYQFVGKDINPEGKKWSVSNFSGGDQTNIFLANRGFNVIEIGSDDHLIICLYNFLEQSQTEARTTKYYIKKYRDLDVDLSFGQVKLAFVTWISFLKGNNKTSAGIYPVFLYERKTPVLYLSFGISATNPPAVNWPEQVTKNYKKLGEMNVSPLVKERYPNTYYFKEYPINLNNIRESVTQNRDKILKDMDEIINIYNGITSGKPGITIDLAQGFKSLLIQKNQIILYGPPGTGKTFLTKELAANLLLDEQPSNTADTKQIMSNNK